MTRRLALALLVCSAIGLLGGPGPARAAAPAVSVAAASDLKFVLDELLVGLKARHPDLTVTVSYGSSGNLAAQLQQGAPFDVYLSADIWYAQELERKGLVQPGSVFEYAIGRLVLWVRHTSPLDVNTLGLEALRDPSIRHTAIANPLHAPYGRAAEAALRSHGVYDTVKPKLVLGDNVAQAAQFVQTGAADAGLIAMSLAAAPAMVSGGRHWEVPPESFPTLRQGGCVMKTARDPRAASLLVAWLTGAEGRAVLQAHGFTVSAAP